MDQVEHECLEHYESNLEKYKDERDAIQKKTFTKWVNKHLTKTGRRVEDLFLDLRDGFNLIALLEALSAETLPKENGYTRFHRIQNVQYCLDFLKKKHIKLVNIRPEDIVEGNGKLTLGLIWTIILNFQVSMIKHRQRELQLAALAADTGYANGHSTHAASSASAASSFYRNATNLYYDGCIRVQKSRSPIVVDCIKQSNQHQLVDIKLILIRALDLPHSCVNRINEGRSSSLFLSQNHTNHSTNFIAPAAVEKKRNHCHVYHAWATGFGLSEREPSTQRESCRIDAPLGQICGCSTNQPRLLWAEQGDCGGEETPTYLRRQQTQQTGLAAKFLQCAWRSASFKDDATVTQTAENQATAKKDNENVKRAREILWNGTQLSSLLLLPSRSTHYSNRGRRRRRPPPVSVTKKKRCTEERRRSLPAAAFSSPKLVLPTPPFSSSSPSFASVRLLQLPPLCPATALLTAQQRFNAKPAALLLFTLLLFRVPSSATGFYCPYAVQAEDEPQHENKEEATFSKPPSLHSRLFCNDCPWLFSRSHAQAELATATLLFLLFLTVVIMHKVFKSYSRKAERKYEHNGGAAQGDTYQRVQHENAGAPYVTSPPSSVRNGASAHHQQQQHQQQQHHQQQQYDSYQRSTARDYSGRSAEYADSTYQRGGAGKEIIPTGDHRYHDQSLLAVHGQQGQGFSESSTYETKEHYEKKMVRKKTRGERERARKANGVHASNGSLSRQGFKVSEVLQAGDGLSARDALLQWAKKVTAGYPGVNVTNFTNSWRDGLAFNAILHRYRPNAVDWQRVSDKNVSNRERLRNAFDTADNEFGVAKLLDPEDVDRENPDEKSIITYVSSLYNALPNLDALSKGDLSDLKSRLARGIGITNEKLDLILKRIEDLEARIDTASPAEIERGIQGIVDDLNALEAPIQEFFEDVEILKQHNDPDANDFHKQVYGLHQRRTAYLDRMGGFGGRLGQRADFLRQEESERYSSIRINAFRRVEEAIEWVRVRTDKLNNMDFNKDLETLEHLFEQHKLDNHDIQDFQQTVKECIARQ
uniref:Calponin-homology (CH) domain-containing protein n=1 Tax=Acrobeloides nanus TaxID=290746 RepID=A0A914C8Q2_9BILA